MTTARNAAKEDIAWGLATKTSCSSIRRRWARGSGMRASQRLRSARLVGWFNPAPGPESSSLFRRRTRRYRLLESTRERSCHARSSR